MVWRCWRPTSPRASLQRPLPGEVVVVLPAALKGFEGRELTPLLYVVTFPQAFIQPEFSVLFTGMDELIEVPYNLKIDTI